MTVWKFEINLLGGDDAEFQMPQGARLLHVGVQSGQFPYVVAIWALVNPTMPTVRRRLYVRGTGHVVPEGVEYVGSTITANGSLVWHVFDEGEVAE